MKMLKHKKPKGKDKAFKEDLKRLRRKRQQGARKNLRRDPNIYVDKPFTTEN